MATQTLATADAILKDLYVGPIVEQLNQKTWLIDQIERDSDQIDHTGRRAVVPVHSGRNRGRGSRGDNANLPVAGKQSYQDAIIAIRYHYYGMELTDPAIEASKTNEGAFINLLNSETKGVATDMRKDINRQVYGTGDGLLSQVRANSTTTTVNVTKGIQYIQVGDLIDVLDGAGAVSGNGVIGATVLTRVLTSGSEAITIDIALAGTATTSYGVYVSGSFGKEMDGMRNITAQSRTLHSINSATAGNEFWNGQQKDASSSTAGESLFEQLADDVGRTGNGEVAVFLTTRGIRRRLADTYQSQKRFNDARAVDIHGGYSAIMVNEIPVVADDDCPLGFAFAIDKSSLKWFQQTSPGWLQQKDGSVFSLKDGSVAGTKQNVWQAWFRWYVALGCVAPQRNGRIINCADDAAS